MGMDLTLKNLDFSCTQPQKIDHIIWRYSFVYLFTSPVSFKEVLLTCLVIFPYKSVQFFFVFTFRAIRPKLTSEFRVELD